MSIQLYVKNNSQVSKLTTRNYSTSFSLGVRMLNHNLHDAIYGIYGYVRYADEIVDTFHEYPQKELLEEFTQQTNIALERGISTNPIIDSFQRIVHQYKIEREHIDAFLKSMQMDLYNQEYTEKLTKEYIYGSAEVVGLMCLRVFYPDNDETYESLKYPARKLGEAFQKVNFLRDINSDYNDRERIYFPEIVTKGFTNEVKRNIEKEIEYDFKEAFKGIKKLNKKARFGVYLAYIYYKRLFRKIKETDASSVTNGRLRIQNRYKFYMLFKAYLKNTINLI